MQEILNALYLTISIIINNNIQFFLDQLNIFHKIKEEKKYILSHT